MATTSNHTGAVAVAFWEDCIECFGDGGDDEVWGYGYEYGDVVF